MKDRMILVFVMVLVINLVEINASSMSGTVNVSSIGLIKQKSHNAICQDSQRKALIEFINEGFNKTDLDKGYRGTKNCCLWGGVTCDTEGLVVSLKLGILLEFIDASQAHPSWPIPLGKLGSLQELELDNVDFGSPLPPAIGLLPQSLVSLSFIDCYLEEPVPWTALANLSSLSYLQISGSLQFMSAQLLPPEVWNLTNLQHLDLSHNSFTGHLPPEVCNLTNLQHLDLSANSFTGHLPPEVRNLANLQHLDLSANSFTGHLPPAVCNLANLKHLSLAHNSFTGHLLVISCLLPHLSYLDLSSNSFFGPIPPFLNSSSSLTLLDLSRNNLHGRIAPAFLGHTINLQFLHLEYNYNLSGSVPGSVANLTNLLELTMAGNQVSGRISHIEWEKLPNLAVLDLGQNQVSGSISEIPWEKLNLTHLDLSKNQLSGTIPASLLAGKPIFTASSWLELYVDLSYNQLWGTIPASNSGQLNITPGQLAYLDLSHNIITGSLPASWIAGQLLPAELDLSHNLLNGSILPWLNATRFSSPLDLSHNLLHGAIPSWYMPPSEVSFSNNLLSGALSLAGLCSGTGRASFYASNNFFSSLLQDFNSTCTSLWRLDLHSNNLKGVMPWNALFGNDTAGISTMNLANNRLSGEFPGWLGNRTYNAPSILILDLSHNLLTGAIPSYLNTWGLGSLDLSSNFFSGEIPSSICQYGSSYLFVLRLADNNISGSIPQELSHCTRLESLVLHNNLLTGFIPAGILSNLSSTLQLLDLAQNRLEGSLPLGLQHMYSLRVLRLQYNNLSGLLPVSLWNTTQLQVLSLSHNHLTGSISAESLSLLQAFCYNKTGNSGPNSTLDEESIIHAKGQDLDFTYIIKATVSLDLSYNNLHGPIPPQLGSLNGLVFLDLSHNQLSGSIPQSLNNLTQLNSLDLSNNNLEGEIPNLCPLTFLEFANVSDNQLNGMIPQCNQWAGYNSTSFLGNKGLCGPQISVSCASSDIDKSHPEQLADEQQDTDDNDFLLAVVVGVCISFPLCLFIIMFWRPVSQPIRIMSKQMIAKFCG